MKKTLLLGIALVGFSFTSAGIKTTTRDGSGYKTSLERALAINKNGGARGIKSKQQIERKKPIIQKGLQGLEGGIGSASVAMFANALEKIPGEDRESVLRSENYFLTESVSKKIRVLQSLIDQERNAGNCGSWINITRLEQELVNAGSLSLFLKRFDQDFAKQLANAEAVRALLDMVDKRKITL
ncbi:MAG TPA: hypothetical protein QGF02_00055 [Candidatus Babeliales bacterium]|nr:hypothetical protein [Candidatus Babeliales bacterium]